MFLKKVRFIGVSTMTILMLSACGAMDVVEEWFRPDSSSAESESSIASESNSSVSSQSSSEEESSSQEPDLASQLIDAPDVHSSDWNLVLVNRDHQLSEDMDFEHYYTENGFIMDQRIADAFETMLADGRAMGLEFVVVSTYRTLAQQEANYQSVYQSYINQGLSHEEAVKRTEDYIALPNASEHSTGLAVDLTEPGLYQAGEGGLVEAFEDTPEGQWLHEHAADYGFILRYPRGKEKITMIQYESWHFRFVGVESAQYIQENNLTLEEYVDILHHNEDIRAQIEAAEQ